jgi:hypothetical protein
MICRLAKTTMEKLSTYANMYAFGVGTDGRDLAQMQHDSYLHQATGANSGLRRASHLTLHESNY